MELNGIFRYPESVASDDIPEKIVLCPGLVSPRPGVIWVERIGGDLEDATPEELELIRSGKPVAWREPNLPNLGKKGGSDEQQRDGEGSGGQDRAGRDQGSTELLPGNERPN